MCTSQETSPIYKSLRYNFSEGPVLGKNTWERREGSSWTGNPLCVRRGREGVMYMTYLVKLWGQGREGVKNPYLARSFTNVPFSQSKLGRIALCAARVAMAVD